MSKATKGVDPLLTGLMHVVTCGPTPATSGFVTTTCQSSSTWSMCARPTGVWATTVASETTALAERAAARILGMRICGLLLFDAGNSASQVESDQAPLRPRQ